MQFYILLLSIVCGVGMAHYGNGLDEVTDGNVTPELLLDMEKDIRVDIYTLENPIEPQVYTKSNWSRIGDSNSLYNPMLPVRILIHGWRSDGRFMKNLTAAYFTRSLRDINLIGINWEKVSGTINYVSARYNVEQVGIYTADLIDYLVEEKLMNLNELQLIGFSLGAHSVGFAGKRATCGQIPKIIGLDPAKPLFDLNKPHERIDANDAKYVEIVHTNGGLLGFFDPIGTINFYANGGLWQPDCGKDFSGLCSHRSAYHYFALSIVSSKPIIGYYCESMEHIAKGNCSQNGKIAVLGGDRGVDEQAKGNYYVTF